ncbi:hypothetical protein E4665_04575 [Sporolactobacillus shoreae]|uniref:LysM domain-containing protein n=1 Tax=Sporolactobacillus shoreae TaxID=1465501 RepID=A0A4Z0GQS4_9BACL|nr:hypothetical protein [Sporolactobacillus shoreae]TGA99603.1 hypothetical protein E4665_04575 [Sporolactobacillus shoreae]
MMKKRIFTILFLVACWTSYSDLTSGSLPAGKTVATTAIQNQVKEKSAVPFQRITVAPGDTLLSVTERISNQVPPITDVINNFSILNPSVDPNHLQIGKVYSFPVYSQKS